MSMEAPVQTLEEKQRRKEGESYQFNHISSSLATSANFREQQCKERINGEKTRVQKKVKDTANLFKSFMNYLDEGSNFLILALNSSFLQSSSRSQPSFLTQ